VNVFLPILQQFVIIKCLVKCPLLYGLVVCVAPGLVNKDVKKCKGSPYSITERRVQELIPVLCSQPAGDVSHKPDCRLLSLSAMPAVTLATLKRAATNFAAW